MTQVLQAPDPQVIEQKMGIAYGAMGGLMSAAMIYVGHQLGIYKGMLGAGVMSSGEVAAKSGLSERFVREWLYQQAALGVVEARGGGKFELGTEAGMIFADESFPLSMEPSLKFLPKFFSEALESIDAFRTGIGRNYDAGGEDGARMIDAFFSGWNRTALSSDALPRLAGVVEKLQAGGKVADVGCGAGAAAIAVAKAFPAAQVHGFDNSKHALKIANESVRTSGVSNVTFHNPDNDPLPAAPEFDLVMTLDCLHDMNRPDLVAKAIRKAIKPDGAWFIVDIDAAPTPDENLASPMASMLFAASVATCLQSSACTPDGLALGTLALPEPEMKKLVTDAGFSSFKRVAGLEHPMNAYYEVRP